MSSKNLIKGVRNFIRSEGWNCMAKFLKDKQAKTEKPRKTIDIHAHILIEKGLEGIRKEFKDYHQIPSGRDIKGRPNIPISNQVYDVKRRIQDMDEMGIDVQALSVHPGSIYQGLNRELSIKLSRTQNDMIAEVVRTHPDRFVGLATVPLQYPEEAAKELDRAVKQLDMKGVEISSNLNRRYLDDSELWPFYERAQELGIIFVHPVNVAGIDRMQKYYLGNLIGNPLDTSLAIASVIFGGVMENFPRLKFCFAHAGGFIPYQRGRLERGYQVRTECKEAISKPPSAYLKLLYFDTITHYAPALKYLIETVGSDHVLLGSDYPFDMGDPKPISIVNNLETISNTEKRRILGENAVKIFEE